MTHVGSGGGPHRRCVGGQSGFDGAHRPQNLACCSMKPSVRSDLLFSWAVDVASAGGSVC